MKTYGLQFNKIALFFTGFLLSIFIYYHFNKTHSMRKILYILICLLSLSSSSAQYEVFESKGKKGVKENGKVIVGAKYADVLLGDSGIFAVNKDGLWGYVNADNDFVLKAKYKSIISFTSGRGIACNAKSGFWDLVNNKGEVLKTLYHYEEHIPAINKKIILFNSAKAVYDLSGQEIVKEFDSLVYINKNILNVMKTKLVPGRFKYFKKDVVNHIIINIETGMVLYDGREEVRKVSDNIYMIKGETELKGLMFDVSGKILLDDFDDVLDTIENQCYVVKTRSGVGVYKDYKWLIVPEPGYGIVLNQGNFWVKRSWDTISPFTGSNMYYTAVRIYDKTGTYTGNEHKYYLRKLGENHFVVYKDYKLYVINAKGEKKTGGYDLIGELEEGLIRVGDNTGYTYIDTVHYKVQLSYFPIVYGNSSSYSSTAGDKAAMMTAGILAAPFFPLIAIQHRKMHTSYGFGLLYSGEAFSEGYSVIAVTTDKKFRHGDSLKVENKYFYDFAFIDRSGKVVSGTYDEVRPFKHGWGWVCTNEVYHRVNKKFETLGNDKYHWVSHIHNNDFYIVENFHMKWGIVDKAGKLVVPCIYNGLLLEEDGVVRGVYNYEKKVVTW